MKAAPRRSRRGSVLGPSRGSRRRREWNWRPRRAPLRPTSNSASPACRPLCAEPELTAPRSRASSPICGARKSRGWKFFASSWNPFWRSCRATATCSTWPVSALGRAPATVHRSDRLRLTRPRPARDRSVFAGHAAWTHQDLPENDKLDAVVEAITAYIAHRLIEREKALAADYASGGAGAAVAARAVARAQASGGAGPARSAFSI